MCAQFSRCEAVRQQMLAELEEAYPKIQALNHWPRRWRGKLCHWCERTARRHYDMGRECAWRHLPRIFGFTSWKELEGQEVTKVGRLAIKATPAILNVTERQPVRHDVALQRWPACPLLALIA